MSKLIKTAAGLAGALALNGAAQAGTTGGTVCVTPPPPPPSCVSCDGPRTGHSTLPPLSSYFEHQARCEARPVSHPAPTPTPAPHPTHQAYPAVVYKYKPTVTVTKPDPCTTVITKCQTTVVKKVAGPIVTPPVVRPPVVHPPIVRPPVVHPPIVYRPPVVRVIRPIVPVPYPVPVPVTYPVYAPCPTGPCYPVVRRSSRYGH